MILSRQLLVRWKPISKYSIQQELVKHKMELENSQNKEIETQEIINNPKIYSSKVIWGFSVIFSTIFGGVLLMQNLKDIGKKKEANLVLVACILYTIATVIVVNIPEHPKASFAYLINMAGGAILVNLVYKKYFPNDSEYEKKKIWKPLIISSIIVIPFIFALIYTQ
jgi:hypothetical protein